MFPILPAGSPEVTDTRLPAFVVAHDGLYLRKQSLLGLSQTKVDGVDHLPAEKEFVEYALPKVPADLMARVVGFFRSVYRERRTEALVLLLWRAEGFDLFVPEQQVSMASVKHRLDESALADDLRVIGFVSAATTRCGWPEASAALSRCGSNTARAAGVGATAASPSRNTSQAVASSVLPFLSPLAVRKSTIASYTPLRSSARMPSTFRASWPSANSCSPASSFQGSFASADDWHHKPR